MDVSVYIYKVDVRVLLNWKSDIIGTIFVDFFGYFLLLFRIDVSKCSLFFHVYEYDIFKLKSQILINIHCGHFMCSSKSTRTTKKYEEENIFFIGFNGSDDIKTQQHFKFL